jgi:hypothetical protein
MQKQQKDKNYCRIFNNNSECQWSSNSPIKTKAGGLNEKTKPNHLLLTRNTLHCEEKYRLKEKG